MKNVHSILWGKNKNKTFSQKFLCYGKIYLGIQCSKQRIVNTIEKIKHIIKICTDYC